MHSIQKKILELAHKKNLARLTYAEIAERIAESTEKIQLIKYHVEKLIIDGYLAGSKKTGSIVPAGANAEKNTAFISIPILGTANCGDALEFADEQVDGYLNLSPSMVKSSGDGKLFAIRAIGESMNTAHVNGKSIEDGDYVIVQESTAVPSDNSYVLSVIDGAANIKKFVNQRKHNRYALLSESTKEQSPIYIHEADYRDFMINGLVIDVIKK